ncbi:hypothetical protein [Jeotgalibacillus soli]|uniref:Uncharacterized protein n=1 Tax=Jeotgalibacillus soli TaxID=889306 RepID=A0A0C2VDJ3_9BACL|nr:hypothetical protein [Jeotgalibacillus soli]KIL42626.1 hypothetical protein KP78_38490 [Jeotgalibacillus soli]
MITKEEMLIFQREIDKLKDDYQNCKDFWIKRIMKNEIIELDYILFFFKK